MKSNKLGTVTWLYIVAIGALLGVLAAPTSTTSPKPSPVHRLTKAQLHHTTHLLEMKAKFESGSCSGTAIGPHALLTAAHCETPEMHLKIDGDDVTVLAMIHDDNDHVIYLLGDIVFDEWAPISTEPLEQGQHLYQWGNPLKFHDLYREGYVSGFDKVTWKDGSTTTNAILTINTTFGDSGSAFFNEHGEINAVLTYTFVNGAFTVQGVLPLAFTEKQIKTAQEY